MKSQYETVLFLESRQYHIFLSYFFFHSVGIPKTISYCAAIFIPNERKPCDIFCNVDFFICFIGSHRYIINLKIQRIIFCAVIPLNSKRLTQKSTCMHIVSCQLLYVLSNTGTSDRNPSTVALNDIIKVVPHRYRCTVFCTIYIMKCSCTS